MTDTEAKRAYVAKLYSGPKWQKQVRRMSDSQVVAIYLREMSKESKPNTEPEPEIEESGSDDIPF